MAGDGTRFLLEPGLDFKLEAAEDGTPPPTAPNVAVENHTHERNALLNYALMIGFDEGDAIWVSARGRMPMNSYRSELEICFHPLQFVMRVCATACRTPPRRTEQFRS